MRLKLLVKVTSLEYLKLWFIETTYIVLPPPAHTHMHHTHVCTLWNMPTLQFSSVQSLSRVQLFVTPWIAARQASLSITNSWSSLRLTSIELVMPSSHLILSHPLLLLPPTPPSIRVFYCLLELQNLLILQNWNLGLFDQHVPIFPILFCGFSYFIFYI